MTPMIPARQEAIALLSEECGEVVQVIGKCLRHGLKSHNPFDDNRVKNDALLEKELGDILAAIDILKDLNVVSGDKIEEATRRGLMTPCLASSSRRQPSTSRSCSDASKRVAVSMKSSCAPFTR